MASDEDDGVFYYLVSHAIEEVYGSDAKQRIDRDVILTYIIVPLNPEGSKRRKTHQLHVVNKPHLKPEDVESSHRVRELRVFTPQFYDRQ